MSSLAAYLRTLPDRCPDCLAHVPTQGHNAGCTADEWTLYRHALRAAADSSGVIHMAALRPLTQGIHHKHRGQLLARAERERLIVSIGREPSTDLAGKNGNKTDRIFRLETA